MSSAVNQELDALWRAVHTLTRHVLSVCERDTFLNDCLDTLIDISEASKGLIVLTDAHGASFSVSARGAGRALSPKQQEEISRTIISDVHRSNRALLTEPGGPGTPSAVAFGIVAAAAAPIRNMSMARETSEPAAPRGVLYVDFRDVRQEVTPRHLEFIEIAAGLIAVVLELSEKLQITEADLQMALATLPGEGPLPTLEELLRPRSMAAIREEISSALNSKQPIVITGESGTGKTLLARAIGEAAGRAPFVRATLGQSDDLNTISSELFGHKAGSFSGALTERKGLVEHAGGGTLLLDEILNLPLPAQQLLLDFTQFGSYRPLGHSAPQPKHSDVRIIAATNGSLEQAVAEGRFREDLYYRLASIKLEVPPLRDRREDIAAMTLGHLRRRDATRTWTLSPDARQLLVSPELQWRGNVRQLESAVERARERALAENPNAETLEARHFGRRELGVAGQAPPAGGTESRERELDLADLGGSWQLLQSSREGLLADEKRVLEAAMSKHGGVVARAARELGMSRTSLVSRLNTYKIAHGRSG